MSEYVAGVRALLGSRFLLLPGVTAVITDAEGRYLLARARVQAQV